MDHTGTTTERADALRRALREIAGNLAFSWHDDARALFHRLDPEAYERTGHSLLAVAAQLSDETLGRAADDAPLIGEVERIRRELAAEATPMGTHEGLQVAYFCAEFGIDESLPIYSGGLGVLAGDHLKSASELGLPLVGVGLLYREGYFRQLLDEHGGQLELYPIVDPGQVPLTLEPVSVAVELAGDEVRLQVWRADVGRVRLYLLDTDVEGNTPEARLVAGTLYGGDRDLRIRQEIVLGIGGVRALAALGVRPTVFHMNEGHSAFLALERIRALVAEGVPTDDAIELVRSSTVFTTHTPVPAGNEVFDPELVHRYLAPMVGACGLSWDEFLALGRADAGDARFGLTPLALRTAVRANGVSALHGEVSRRMWHELWPDRRVEDVPIEHVTNGVHPRTWLALPLERLLRARGVRPEAATGDAGWERATSLDPRELWDAHREGKHALAATVARRPRHPEVQLDPEALTLGFARRFATYKRGDLLLSDPERLARLLGDDDRPVQIVFGGKSHPADEPGKSIIRNVVEVARSPLARGRVVFLEDYDLALARRLVQGVDVWVNTPRRPLEASGTSGMKAGLNGVPNLSILDGWWAEGYAPGAGWAIEGGDGDESTQDARDAAALYDLLEHVVVPLYHERDGDGVPQRWVELMKTSIALIGSSFTSHRMVADYTAHAYLPAHRAGGVLRAERMRAA